MFSGILFLTVTGLLWVALGAVISRAAQKKLNVGFIQGVSGAFISLLMLPAAFAGKLPAWNAALFIFIAGFINYYIFLLMNKAMQTGPNGLIWAMCQSAFAFPFLMGIIFFSVPCSVFRIAGLVILFTATVLMGVAGDKKQHGKAEGKSRKWLWYTVITFIIVGLDQSFANLPSYLMKDDVCGFTGLAGRSGICGAGFAAAWILHCLFSKECRYASGCSFDVTLMTASTIGATVCLFYGLDCMAKAGAGAIGYPMATGVTIASFQVYTAVVLKEKLSPLSLSGILFCLTGTILLCL